MKQKYVYPSCTTCIYSLELLKTRSGLSILVAVMSFAYSSIGIGFRLSIAKVLGKYY
ncbi:hypothetical protein Hanom_Chr08g00685561 [Helianthus anomalus]